jgi:hypothetical protein
MRVRGVANKLGGVAYVAENVNERTRTEMPGAGLTFFVPRRFWSLDQSILEVRGKDTDDGRTHHGDLKIDTGVLTAQRTLHYDTPYERSGQRIEFSDDYRTLHVDAAGYGRHVLRRARGTLMLG